MDKKLALNYITCPSCSNILELCFISGTCPNPNCSFIFKGLEPYLNKSEGELSKLLTSYYKKRNEREYKLIATAVRFNMPTYLSNFIGYSWGSQAHRLFKEFIKIYLDDLTTLKMVLKSDAIKSDKQNTIISKGKYKMFPELFSWLMEVNNAKIGNFLRLEYPKLYREWYKKMTERLKKPIINTQLKLV